MEWPERGREPGGQPRARAWTMPPRREMAGLESALGLSLSPGAMAKGQVYARLSRRGRIGVLLRGGAKAARAACASERLARMATTCVLIDVALDLCVCFWEWWRQGAASGFAGFVEHLAALGLGTALSLATALVALVAWRARAWRAVAVDLAFEGDDSALLELACQEARELGADTAAASGERAGARRL